VTADTDASRTGIAATKRPSRWTRRRVLTIAVAAVVVLLVAVGSLIYTERPQFCPACHEMGPYYEAWTVGPHNEVSCVDCHVDPGVVNHGLHKLVALKELWNHFTRVNLFPNYAVELPDSRCVACHATVKDTLGAKFSHAVHAGKAPCKDCHTTVGHTVTLAALDQAGILKPAAADPPIPAGATPSVAAGHLKVACQRCHDQAKMKCSQCHKATHEVKPGECSDCHVAGTKFLFKHPADTACTRCHKAPANHYGDSCAKCHAVGVAFRNATFRHSGNTGEHSYRSFACAKCHPKGYASASCTCHGGKVPRGD
jgi:nitrate/TMAO reductase-like tetraheme cytochrome c subunit